MENNQSVIQFYDFNDQQKRGRQLPECSISIWYNINEKHRTYGCTLSNDIYSEFDYVRIGKIGSDNCLVFSEAGIKLYGKNRKQNKKGNLVFSSKGFVELIFPEIQDRNHEGKGRKIFQLNQINDEVLIIKNEVK